MSLTQTEIKGTVTLASDGGANTTIGNSTGTTAITGTTNINITGGKNTTIGTTNSGTNTIRGAIVNIGDTTGQVNICLTNVSTGPTPKIANITQNHDATTTYKGCSLLVGNNKNEGGNPYRLYLAGSSDPLHYIYSTGQGGDQTYFGEYGNWNFYSTNLNTTRATINNATGAYSTGSDRNIKKDLEPSTLGITEILQLKPTLYRFKNNSIESEEQDKQEPKSLGFIAQEVQPILPKPM